MRTTGPVTKERALDANDAGVSLYFKIFLFDMIYITHICIQIYNIFHNIIYNIIYNIIFI